MKRVKRRYLSVQVECDGLPSERELVDVVWGSLTRLFGEVGASTSGFVLISFDVERKVAVLRVALACLPLFRASLAAVTSVGGKAVCLHVLGVSGTLKALRSQV